MVDSILWALICMSNVLQNLKICLATYTIIPIPKQKWTKETTKYMLAFFPLTGVLIGLALYGFTRLSLHFEISAIFYSIFAATLSTILSGGIHMDGFCNTCDAIGGKKSRAEKLKILEDNNTNSNAIIGGILLLFIKVACFSEIYRQPKLILIPCIFYVTSRALTGLVSINFKQVINSDFSKAFIYNNNSQVQTSLIFFFLISMVAVFFINITAGVIALILVLLVTVYYIFSTFKNFGGVVADTAGYYLELCELFLTFSIVVANLL